MQKKRSLITPPWVQPSISNQKIEAQSESHFPDKKIYLILRYNTDLMAHKKDLQKEKAQNVIHSLPCPLNLKS